MGLVPPVRGFGGYERVLSVSDDSNDIVSDARLSDGALDDRETVCILPLDVTYVHEA